MDWYCPLKDDECSDCGVTRLDRCQAEFESVMPTLACQRLTKAGRKRAQCPCTPCRARRAVFGANVNVPEQEQRREDLAAGRIVSLECP